MRRLLSLLLLASLVAFPAFVGQASAASAYRLPPVQLRPSQAPAAAKPAAKPVQQSRPPALAGTLLPQPSFAAAPGLAALGLETMRLGAADAAPACRQACAASRYMCGVEDESCADQWRQCLQGCSSSGLR